MDEDNQLIKDYINGDENSLKILIDKYTFSIYNFSSKFVGIEQAKDITQEVFVKVWKNLRKFREEKSKFKTWLFVIARNTMTDYLRKKKTIPFSNISEEDFKEENIEDGADLPDEVLQKLQDKEMLLKILNELPVNYKEVLTLYYQEDLSFKEIGEILNKPLHTVKSHHRRALILLKTRLA